ncbi:hypothetical protein RUM44_004446 [Polyplax serrata]|uniref:Uncharacterized protein n=1 Tax=Polyplax serrata TaxID=468196 RepID=A0ABR1B2V8_POLSC
MGESAVRGGLVEGTRELHLRLRSEWSVLECWRKPRCNLKPVSVRRPGAQTQTVRESLVFFSLLSHVSCLVGIHRALKLVLGCWPRGHFGFGSAPCLTKTRDPPPLSQPVPNAVLPGYLSRRFGAADREGHLTLSF